jgi:hypothetical protein
MHRDGSTNSSSNRYLFENYRLLMALFTADFPSTSILPLSSKSEVGACTAGKSPSAARLYPLCLHTAPTPHCRDRHNRRSPQPAQPVKTTATATTAAADPRAPSASILGSPRRPLSSAVGWGRRGTRGVASLFRLPWRHSRWRYCQSC